MNLNTWHFEQLKKELKNRRPKETDRIDLVNPEVTKHLDQQLWNNFWIPIESIVNQSRFCFMDGTLKNGKPEIRNKWDSRPCRSAELQLDNPEPAYNPDYFYKNWIARIQIDCHQDHYYLQTKYTIHFPLYLNIQRILDLMCNTNFQTIPPELSWSIGGPMGPDLFSLEFIFGSGADWPYGTGAKIPEIVTKRMEALIHLLETTERFAENIKDNKNFGQLEYALVRSYETWG